MGLRALPVPPASRPVGSIIVPSNWPPERVVQVEPSFEPSSR